MHKFMNTASPYLCEITLDVERVFGSEDVERFESSVERGVAVFGHTPNLLILADGIHKEWESICNLLSALHTGKVAVCGGSLTNNQIEMMKESNVNILLKIF